MSSYVMYHCHSDWSLLDSTTKFEDYVKLAQDNGMTALGSSEHGLPRGNLQKKIQCQKAGIKFLYGVECYLTRDLKEKVRDNYHTVLIARNLEGYRELNMLMKLSTQDDHRYYMNRLTFDEFMHISRNIIKISACIASPLSKLELSDPWYEKLARHYDYLEIQHHDCDAQRQYNQWLCQLAHKLNKPLIAGTDTHSSSAYKEACRKLLLKSKGKNFPDEDQFDLVFKTYDELVAAYQKQDALPENVYLQAIENTNVMADSVEDFEIDRSIKYPISYGSEAEDARRYAERVERMFRDKLDRGIIPREQEAAFRAAIDEEMRVFTKTNMCGFMLSMSELICWCHDNGICTGSARGSVAGSRVAYVTDIIDVNPEQWHTIFSRFCNENRVEPGDIDTDCIESDRPKIFQHIIERFGERNTARVSAYGTIQAAGTIDEICRGLKRKWIDANRPEFAGHYEKLDDRDIQDCPFIISQAEKIKAAYDTNPDQARVDYPDVFRYFDGMVGTRVSQSVHAAGIVVSPVSLDDNYGTFWNNGEHCLLVDMDDAHDFGMVKYDMLVLSNVQIIRDACREIGIQYPRTYEIDWNDQKVWKDMLRCQYGIFQMESDFAFSLLRKFQPKSIFDMSLVTACIRPSGASYRDDLMARIPRHNPSKIIDDMLKDNLGYLVYQCDVIAFLQNICGFSGSEADTVRRDIAHKDPEKIAKALPKILDGYCAKSDKPREVAEKEATQFLKVIEEASSYMFGYNHSIAYCLLGYICAWLRCYHPAEFIVSFLNHAAKDEDIAHGHMLAQIYGIGISSARFGVSRSNYHYDKATNTIYKGVASIAYMNDTTADLLLEASKAECKSFMDVLQHLPNAINARQLDILIQLDFFAAFGNPAELTAINAYFTELNKGTLTRVAKDKVEAYRLSGIIESAATDQGKAGTLESWTITEMPKLLSLCEAHVRSQHLPPPKPSERASAQMEYLGYVEPLGNDGKALLYVTSDVRVLTSKKTGKPWAYSFTAVSLKDGGTHEWTIKDGSYLEQFAKGDILRVVPETGSGKPVYTNSWYPKTYNGRTYYYLCRYRLAEAS